MENKTNVVFELSKINASIINEDTDWLDFIASFVIDVSNRAEIYFLINSNDMLLENNAEVKIEKIINKVIKAIKLRNETMDLSNIKFGFYNDPLKFEDKKTVWFYERSNLDNVIELENNSTIFFCSSLDMIMALVYSDFFVYYLDFDNLDTSNRKKRKAKKYAMGYVNSITANKLNYAQANYEFLTFLESQS